MTQEGNIKVDPRTSVGAGRDSLLESVELRGNAGMGACCAANVDFSVRYSSNALIWM